MVEKDAVSEGYDEIADVYLAERSPSAAETTALGSFLEPLTQDSTILDAGCGGGEPVLTRLTDHTRQAIGMDLSGGQLERAQRAAPAAALVRGDMATLPIKDDALDAVLAYHSLIHVPGDEHRTVIDEFARVLRPGGRLLVSEGPGEWQGTNLDWLDAGVEMQWYIAGAETTRAQLSTAGFDIIQEYGAPNTLAEDEDARWIFFEAVLDPSAS